MSEPVIAVLPGKPKKSFAYRRLLNQLAGWSILLAIASAALVAGLILRRFAWDQTEPIRYTADIDNAFRQGTRTLQSGYVERYDFEIANPDPRVIMALDYAPGRLAIATLWSRWVHDHDDGGLRSTAERIRRAMRTPYSTLGAKSKEDLVAEWPSEFYPRVRSEKRQYELCQPMLMVNVTGEILSALAIFLLTRRYTLGQPPVYRPVRGAILGFIAALFFWFNPALLSNAHCWPQWDSWVLPFFLWGVLLASLNWWFCAGMLIGAGAMFKGQILFGAPIFILWPLFQGRLMALVRWIIGLLFSTALATCVWLVRTPGFNIVKKHYQPGSVNLNAITWLVYLAVLFSVVVMIVLWPRRREARIPVAIAVAWIIGWIISPFAGQVAAIICFVPLAVGTVYINFKGESWKRWVQLSVGCIAAGILLYPLLLLSDGRFSAQRIAHFTIDIFALALLCIVIKFAPRRAIPFAAAAWMACGALACIPLFNSSTAWFDRGIAFGTHHYERMSSGENNNLADLLQEPGRGWNWTLMEPVFTLPKGPFSDRIAKFLDDVDPGVHLKPGVKIGLPLKYFLLCLWIVSVILCAIGTAVHDRRRSPRFLASIAAPWIMFFAVMTQMHQRYLLWGASISAATVALSPGYAVLSVFLSIVSMSQELMSMITNNPAHSNLADFTETTAYKFFSGWHPGVTYALLLTACIYVFNAVKIDRPGTVALVRGKGDA